MEKITELFESVNSEILTEEVKLQISTLFEAAVNEAIKQKETELEEANKVEIKEFKDQLTESVDEYLDYFVKEYIKENETIVEDFTKVKLAEKVLRNFQQMVEAFNISLSEESISSEDEIEELQTENNKLINQLIEARKETELVKKAAMVAEAAAELETDIQREKLVEMAKDLEFDEELFESKLGVLVESIKTKKEEKTEEKLEEKVEDIKPEKVISESVKSYLKFLK